MKTSLSELIQWIEVNLKELQERSSIPRPRTLISACSQLDRLIGLQKLKQAIVNQIKVAIYRRTNNFKSKTPNYSRQMLHYCMMGPPGGGKSSVSKILAKIWYALGADLRAASSVTLLNSPRGGLSENLALELSMLGTEVMASTHQAQKHLMALHSGSMTENRSIPTTLLEPHAARSPPSSPHLSRNKLRVSSSPVINSLSKSETNLWARINTELNNTTMKANALNNRVNAMRIEDAHEEEASAIVDDPEIAESEYLVMAGRESFVASYMGQTTQQAIEFIRNNFGKTIIVEEAYTLYQGERDQFGSEALVVINRAMDEWADSIIFCFNGYAQQLEDSIFTAQPGLKRRLSHVYATESYTFLELAQIFGQQLERLGLSVENLVDVSIIMREHLDEFPNYAGDTLRLSYMVEMAFCTHNFESLMTHSPSRVINAELLKKGLQLYRDSRRRNSIDAHLSMYT